LAPAVQNALLIISRSEHGRTGDDGTMAAAAGRGSRAAQENGAHAGVVPMEQARGMKGLDIMQALLEGRFPYPPIAETLDFALVQVERGQAIFQGTPQQSI
jgi:hypothetical protein